MPNGLTQGLKRVARLVPLFLAWPNSPRDRRGHPVGPLVS